jgi:hypothetical protein
MTPRRAITPPSGSVRVPRIATMKAPADMTPTVAPPVAVRRKDLETARRTLVTHADAIRAALATLNCHPPRTHQRAGSNRPRPRHWRPPMRPFEWVVTTAIVLVFVFFAIRFVLRVVWAIQAERRREEIKSAWRRADEELAARMADRKRQ